MSAASRHTGQGQKAGSASVARPIALPGTSDGDRASVKAVFGTGKAPRSPRKGQHGGNKGENTDVAETTFLPHSLVLLLDVINVMSPSDLVQSWVCLRTKYRCKVLLNIPSCSER